MANKCFYLWTYLKRLKFYEFNYCIVKCWIPLPNVQDHQNMSKRLQEVTERKWDSPSIISKYQNSPKLLQECGEIHPQTFGYIKLRLRDRKERIFYLQTVKNTKVLFGACRKGVKYNPKDSKLPKYALNMKVVKSIIHFTSGYHFFKIWYTDKPLLSLDNLFILKANYYLVCLPFLTIFFPALHKQTIRYYKSTKLNQ